MRTSCKHILIKYASRSRPRKFFDGLLNIIDMAANKEDYTVLCCLDTDDLTMFWEGALLPAWFVEIHSHDHLYRHVRFDFGQSSSKINAINRPIPADLQWDILINFSDDMRFTVFGYDDLIRDGFRCNGDDLFLHYPDSTAKNMLSTMSIMDRKYYERDGYIYHPSYQSVWCDNEAQDVTKIRGRYRYMGIQIFDHYHPAYGQVPWDAQYQHQQNFWNEDEANYNYRKSHNFFLDATEHTDPNRSGTPQAV